MMLSSCERLAARKGCIMIRMGLFVCCLNLRVIHCSYASYSSNVSSELFLQERRYLSACFGVVRVQLFEHIYETRVRFVLLHSRHIRTILSEQTCIDSICYTLGDWEIGFWLYIFTNSAPTPSSNHPNWSSG